MQQCEWQPFILPWSYCNKLVSTFFTTGDNNWYYADAKGELVVGEQTINGQNLTLTKL
ncbi:MAG: hypothetical protein ACLUFP_05530 [Streptococcus salivarius]